MASATYSASREFAPPWPDPGIPCASVSVDQLLAESIDWRRNSVAATAGWSHGTRDSVHVPNMSTTKGGREEGTCVAVGVAGLGQSAWVGQ